MEYWNDGMAEEWKNGVFQYSIFTISQQIVDFSMGL